MPKETFIQFKEVTKIQKLPFTIYADFVKLEIPVVPDMHMFLYKGLTGWIGILSNHYAKENNPEI